MRIGITFELWAYVPLAPWQNHANLTRPVNFSTSKTFLVKISAKSEKKIFGPNLTSKSQNFDLWPHFWPWKWQNHANLTRPVNFSTSKTFLVKISAKSEKKIYGPYLTSKSQISTFDPIFDPENGKIMQIWPNQWISRPQKLSWWKFQPIRRKKFSDQIWPQSCYAKHIRNVTESGIVTKPLIDKTKLQK